MRLTSLFASALCLGLVLSAGPGRAAEKSADAKPALPPGATPEQAERMQKMMTPGEPHKRLAALAGTFDAVMTCHVPGGPGPSKGTMKYEMILGGRWLRSEYTGEMMGQKFEGVQLFGYDNATGKYVGSWVDNMGTAMAQMEGQADAAGNVITLKSEGIDPTTNQKAPMRIVLTIVDADRHTFEMHMPGPDGKDMTMMDIAYTRAK